MTVDKSVLLVKNLPEQITSEDINEILTHFGATDVTYFQKCGKMKPRALATFQNVASANAAMQRLHQLEILGERLVIEYSDSTKLHLWKPTESEKNRDDASKNNQDDNRKQKETETRSSTNHSIGNLIQIADKIGLNYPFSPRLMYCYPPPNPATIHNIANALINVPKLYYQVLHLMNKMNLPAPFGPEVYPGHSFPHVFNAADASTGVEKNKSVTNSEEESELESEDEHQLPSISEVPVSAMPVKRKRLAKSSSNKRSRMKSLLSGTSAITSESHESVSTSAVFELPTQPTVQKKIEFKISASSTATAEEVSDEGESLKQTGTFGVFTTDAHKSDEKLEDEVVAATKEQENEFISEKALKENRISAEGMNILPAFKNYQTGKPSSRLYLKNLAKQVVEKDLYFIYGHYASQASEEEKHNFDIRLMKEGRMKGQAFVTLPNENLAINAVKDTNGYMLHGKPIVVQFAHSSKSRETT